MTPQKSPCESLPDDMLSVKDRFIRAAHTASPMRFVEKNPWVAVTATAAGAMGVTVIATSTFAGRVGGGFIANGMALFSSLTKSPLITQLASAALAGKIAEPNAPTPPPPTAAG